MSLGRVGNKILSFFGVNNPDHFPEFNETALKKHILSHMYSFELKHPFFLEFMRSWQPDSLGAVAHKDFGAEVYRYKEYHSAHL